ncbi:glycoside hydrolase family 2 TIM barrel-domain containing protein, partial [Mediterraneibacter gnavus]
KLKGVCLHHDQGALGAVANRDAIERQVKILKEMGCNAIRVTHNPAASVLLEVCNENGMLVINEAFDGWTEYKNGNVNDYTS